MSTLSDEYIKNFSKERKAIFNKRFSDDYDPNMSERSNIIRILNEMRELGLADGGRIGLKEGLGSFETNDPGEAIKEIINRMINVEGATFPISENISLNLGPDLNQAELGGIIKILGGELNLGIGQKGDEKAIGLSFSKEFNKGGRVGFRIGSDEGKDVSGREYASDTATSRSVATSPSRDTGGGGDDNQPPPQKTFTTTQKKDSTKKNVLKNIGGFAFNRFLNAMGVPTKDIQKALVIKGILEQAGNVIFPEGDFQKIKATSPDQRTYNIEATKDLVENNPLGIIGETLAPVTSLVTSPFYDGTQAFQRMEPGSGIKGFAEAFAAEKPISSALERAYGATLPLAERISGQKLNKGGLARMLGE